MLRRNLVKLGFIALMALGTSISQAAADDAELVVGVSLSGTPYGYRTGDGYAGFDIDFWNEIAAGIGRKFRYAPMEFGSLIPGLQTNNLDVVSASMFIKPERQKVVDFSTPYYQAGLIAIAKIDDGKINAPADLDGKIVATETGNGAVDYLQKDMPNAQISQYPDINAALLALSSGRADAVVFDSPKLTLYAHTAGDGKVKVIRPLLTTLDVGLAVQKGSNLLGPINEQIAAMKADGRLDALKKKWFGE